MEDKIEIQNALRLARDIITRERQSAQPASFQSHVMDDVPAPIVGRSLTNEAIRRRGLEVARQLQ